VKDMYVGRSPVGWLQGFERIVEIELAGKGPEQASTVWSARCAGHGQMMTEESRPI